ncbi:hypothetical protein HPB52_008084 [Rhipicephalus sanguineus]|uniref:Ionotropic glutamate receptor L-glutamate and glycine-binding domain-containing protein n=1 Tax=Rhipicephalus sanguineus TaxID=34632 RepID=A0A9D4SYC8_RHISA|nr:hypothetical protein HPB52_008084 [Rhipicephalus sanguineus]
MAVALISFLLLTQASVVIKPLNKDAPADSTDGNACGLRDTEAVLRRSLPATMDSQKCPALTEWDFSSLLSCQQWTLGGAGMAGDIQLQVDRSGTSSTGHGTGDMAVAFISFLLLTQMPPMSTVVTPPGGTPKFAGMSGFMLDLVTESMGFKYVVKLPPDYSWGARDAHGRWAGQFGMVVRNVRLHLFLTMTSTELSKNAE